MGATTPLPYPVRSNFCVCSRYLARSNCVPNFSIVSLCIMQLCEYVFPIGLPLYVPKNGVLGGFEGEDVKILCSDPQKALLCVNTRLLVYHRLWSHDQRRDRNAIIIIIIIIACQNRFNGLSSRSVERFCVQRKKEKKNQVVTLAIWGAVTPAAILTKCRVWGDIVSK